MGMLSMHPYVNVRGIAEPFGQDDLAKVLLKIPFIARHPLYCFFNKKPKPFLRQFFHIYP